MVGCHPRQLLWLFLALQSTPDTRSLASTPAPKFDPCSLASGCPPPSVGESVVLARQLDLYY